jgi:cation-transporting ATPase I
MGLLDPLSRLLDPGRRRARRVWSSGGHAHIEVRPVDPSEVERFAQRLEAELGANDAVRWVEAGGVVGRVVVAFDEQAASAEELVELVESVEYEFGVQDQPFGPGEPPHPADVEPLVRTAAMIGGSAVGLGIAAVRRAARLPPMPLVAYAAAGLSTLEHQPRLRRLVEHGLGSKPAEAALALGSGVVQGLAGSPLGPVVDIAHRSARLAEMSARRTRWLEREPALCEAPSGHPKARPDVGVRGVPLAGGPIEEFEDRALPASLGGAGITLAATRSVPRTAAMLQAGLPKAAHYGREGFAAHVGRMLSSRGVLPLDPEALRKLDRVNWLVVDAGVLLSDERELSEILMVASANGDRAAGVEEAECRARGLFDGRSPSAVRRRGGWTLAPMARLGLEPPRGRKRAATRLARGGVLLGLVHRHALVALTGSRPRLRAGAKELIAAARLAGLDVAITGRDDGVAARLGCDRVVPDGSRLPRAIRLLQREGAVVLVVAGGGSAGLPAADVALGLRTASGPPPWAADLLAEDDDLAHAQLIIQACSVARRVARDSTLVATVGAATGAAAALLGRPSQAVGRTMNAVNAASAVALANGTRAGIELARLPMPSWPEPVPWHELEAHDALDRLGTPPGGLSLDEATRRQRPEAPAVPGPVLLARAVAAELVNPFTPILVSGAGLAAAVGSTVDALMVGGVMMVNALIGGVERQRADRAIERLDAQARQSVLTIRAGQEGLADTRHVVDGDLIRLRAGDTVPADCRIVDARALEVDESSLTGESLPVPKGVAPSFAPALADRSSMLFEGSAVAAGQATAVVVATGPDTEARRSAHLPGAVPPPSGLEARLRTLSRLSGPVAVASAGLLAGLAGLRGASLAETVESGVALSAAAVPEGLPLLTTVAQLSAARRLAERRALVRSRRAIEALGRVDVACVDKTGTLTEGRIALVALSDGVTEVPIDAPDLAPEARRILAASLRASPAPGRDDLLHAEDRALVDGAGTAAVTASDGADEWQRLAELPFESGRAYHAVLGNGNGSTRLLTVKGAPEVILARCSTWPAGGAVDRLTGPRRRRLMERAHDMAKRGLRVLAVAERDVPAAASLDADRIEGLAFVGFIAYSDPVRPEAAAALGDLQRAGVEVVMITGDHPSTAASIASELDLVDGKRIVTGPDLEAMDDDELADALPGIAVFARVTPLHKVRIVRAFQRAGRVVAMTGDGANDAQAIRLADVGIAFGERSTPAAKEAADLVVVDDRVETLVDALLEGRALWASARDAASILVGGNLGEIGFMVAGSAIDGRAPLNARQLLLVNLLTDTAPALAIAVRQPSRPTPEQLVREGPEASLGTLARDIVVRAALTSVGATGAWFVGRATGTRAHASTVGMTAVVGTQLGQTLLVGGRDPVVAAAGLGSAAILAGIVQTPGLSHAFGCRPLGPIGWTVSIAASAAATAGAVALPRVVSALPVGGSESRFALERASERAEALPELLDHQLRHRQDRRDDQRLQQTLHRRPLQGSGRPSSAKASGW